MTPRTIEYPLYDIDEYTGFTKYDLVDEAVTRREGVTPHLLAIHTEGESPEEEQAGEEVAAAESMRMRFPREISIPP